MCCRDAGGVGHISVTTALVERIAAFRPELTSTQSAREAARYLLLTPPLPVVARAPYGLLAATSVFRVEPYK